MLFAWNPSSRSQHGCRPLSRARRFAPVLLVPVAAVVMAGCAANQPGPKKEPVVDATGAGAWACMEVEGVSEAAWQEGDSSWRQSGGSLVSLQRSALHDDDLAPTREEAVERVASASATAAMEALEARGVSFSDERRSHIERRAAAALASGGEPDFPRIRLSARWLEKCTRAGTEEVAWRASALVEYPIGLLKGDANNVEWERGRLSGEAKVLLDSGEEFFESGRWFDGLVELSKAAAAVDSMGLPIESRNGGGEGRPSEHVDLALRIRESADEALRSLSAEPVGAPIVLEQGARADVSMEFAFTFGRDGVRAPAAGVPVVFEMSEGAALLDGRPETDESGIARCTLVSAYGPSGEARVTASVAPAVMEAVAGLAPADSPPASADMKVFLVRGGHAVSVCFDFSSASEGDASLAEVGCSGRLARDGFLVDECGPDVNVLLRADVLVETESIGSGWETNVRIGASAFDQRVAREIARTTISVGESGEGRRREIEATALREAGRLLAVYLERRMLASGTPETWR